jgi:sarcosine oxidase subunit gamma
LALIDLSLLPKTGYRGPQALPWLEAQQLELPPNNRGAIQPDGALVVRLGDGEALLLKNPMLENPLLGNPQGNSELLDRLGKEHSREPPAGVYPVPRADSTAWFVVSGRLAPEMLAKLCGVDLSPEVFPQLEVAQTSVARANAIVLRWDVGETLAYHLFPGAALAEYLWDCLMDAMVEYGGRPTGLEAMWSLLAAGK